MNGIGGGGARPAGTDGGGGREGGCERIESVLETASNEDRE